MAIIAQKYNIGDFEPSSVSNYLSILSFAYAMADDNFSKRCFEKNREQFESLTIWQEDFERAVLELFDYTSDLKYAQIPTTKWLQPFAPAIAALYEAMPKLLKWGGLTAKLPEFKAKRGK
jgi:hypothetical protein